MTFRQNSCSDNFSGYFYTKSWFPREEKEERTTMYSLKVYWTMASSDSQTNKQQRECPKRDELPDGRHAKH